MSLIKSSEPRNKICIFRRDFDFCGLVRRKFGNLRNKGIFPAQGEKLFYEDKRAADVAVKEGADCLKIERLLV